MEKNKEEELYKKLKELLKSHSRDSIASTLNVSSSAVKRWEDNERVPYSYIFDILKLEKKEIDYSQFSSSEKDQFFTPLKTAEYCFQTSIKILKKYNDTIHNYCLIEPSAGNGIFFNLFPIDKRIGMDIEPMNNGIIKQDFLDWRPDNKNQKYIVIGNPPFGLRGQLALKFINHSFLFADYVCFILPQLFESDGKGVPRKRVKGFNLIHSESLNTDFENPNKQVIKIKCIFQIWSKNYKNSLFELLSEHNTNIQIYSVSDGGTPSSTRNKKMHNKCHIFLPSTVYERENMRWFTTFEELPKRRGYGILFLKNVSENIKKCKDIDWSSIAFLSTNSAYNLRKSKILEAINKYSSL